MRKFSLLFACILILASCSKEEAVQDTDSFAKSGIKVGICHKNAGEIVISESALQTHIDHGDAIDRDGDGFYDKENPCSETDCDDEDYSLENSCGTPAFIGELREGGVVFWVDPTDNTHGLVCALQNTINVYWGCDGTDLGTPNVVGNPTGTGAEIGDGYSNTMAILLDCPDSPVALAATSLGDGWFLPSIMELNEMIVNKNILESTSGVSPFNNLFYGIFLWSSTEMDAGSAWAYSDQFGLDIYANGKGYNPQARAVKAF